jgi:hypothetical protein
MRWTRLPGHRNSLGVLLRLADTGGVRLLVGVRLHLAALRTALDATITTVTATKEDAA